jgi:putative transposase
MWADGGYAGRAVDVVREATGIDLEIVRRPGASQGTLVAAGQEPPPTSGFKVLPHRWIVERTFGWIGRYRRLSKDYEQTTDSSTAWILLAMVRLLTRRLGVARI